MSRRLPHFPTENRSIARRARLARSLARPLAALVLATGAPLLGGCDLINFNLRPTSFADNAKENYDKGQEELKHKNWLDAIKYFQYTRAKFGFSKWATLSELAIADAHVGAEKYQEAVDEYRAFLRAHPQHERVVDGYAAYRVGDAFYRQIPTEWFLVPPAYEKDQGPVRDALRELSRFVQEYPDSQYAKPAQKQIDDCHKRLADHELYVADFYLGRKKPMAAIGRLEGLVKAYPHSSVEPKALLLLGKTYLSMEKPGEARRSFEQLIAAYPEHGDAKKAQLYLDYIHHRWPGVDAVPVPSEPTPPAAAPAPVEAPPAPPGP